MAPISFFTFSTSATPTVTVSPTACVPDVYFWEWLVVLFTALMAMISCCTFCFWANHPTETYRTSLTAPTPLSVKQSRQRRRTKRGRPTKRASVSTSESSESFESFTSITSLPSSSPSPLSTNSPLKKRQRRHLPRKR